MQRRRKIFYKITYRKSLQKSTWSRTKKRQVARRQNASLTCKHHLNVKNQTRKRKISCSRRNSSTTCWSWTRKEKTNRAEAVNSRIMEIIFYMVGIPTPVPLRRSWIVRIAGSNPPWEGSSCLLRSPVCPRSFRSRRAVHRRSPKTWPMSITRAEIMQPAARQSTMTQSVSNSDNRAAPLIQPRNGGSTWTSRLTPLHHRLHSLAQSTANSTNSKTSRLLQTTSRDTF